MRKKSLIGNKVKNEAIRLKFRRGKFVLVRVTLTGKTTEKPQ